MSNGKTHYTWPFSIAMLVYQRVCLPTRTALLIYIYTHCLYEYTCSMPGKNKEKQRERERDVEEDMTERKNI